MTRVIVNYANGHYLKGQHRLVNTLDAKERLMLWHDKLPTGCPFHQDVPYAFKAYAMAEAVANGAGSVLWLDACIWPVTPLDRLWDQIERDGYMILRNGYWNAEWTADSAYPLLGVSREENAQIPHVVGGVIGLNVRHEMGRYIFEEYFRLAKSGAFIGPWVNGPANGDPLWKSPCGPETTKGHRHDQTALSVVAYRAGCTLTNPPDIFAYADKMRPPAPETILVADGDY